MIKDYVRDGVAFLGCTKCSCETTILKYDFREGYSFPTINAEKSQENMHLFITTHSLCKGIAVEPELPLNNKAKNEAHT